MKFLSIRDLRSSTAQIKDMLSNDGKIVLTTNGKPTALLIEISEESIEDVLIDLRVAQARRSLRQLQEQSVRTGLNNLTLEDINSEISDARREMAGI